MAPPEEEDDDEEEEEEEKEEGAEEEEEEEEDEEEDEEGTAEGAPCSTTAARGEETGELLFCTRSCTMTAAPRPDTHSRDSDWPTAQLQRSEVGWNSSSAV